MGNPISSRISYEYTPHGGLQLPQTVYSSRSLLPSYQAVTGTNTVHGVAPVTISLPVGSLTSGQYTTLSKTQGLGAALAQLNLSPYDIGTVTYLNASIQCPTNVAAFHPQIQVVTNQGNPLNGTLQSGTTYNGIALSATVQVVGTGTSNAGNVILTCTVMVLGGVTS